MPFRFRSGLLLAASLLGFALLPSAAAAAGSTPDPAPIKLIVNEKIVKTDTAPFLENGTAYLPLRLSGELLGCLVSWDSASKTFTLQYPKRTVQMAYDAAAATVNGQSVPLSEPLRIVDSQIYVPLRFLSEAVGSKIWWDAPSRSLHLNGSEEYVKRTIPNDRIWLSRGSGELYLSRDDYSPAVPIGRIEAAFQGSVSLQGDGSFRDGSVITVVDRYGAERSRYDVYSLLLHDGRIAVQTKAGYEGLLDSNSSSASIEEADGSMSPYAVLTDGRTATLYDEKAQPAGTYDMAELAGKEDSYFVHAIGQDYMIVRPMSTGLLTLIDFKDHTVTTLADQLLSGKELEAAHSMPSKADGLAAAADMGNGQLDFFYNNLNGGGHDRLSYYRPSYEKERQSLPKPRAVDELAAECSSETVKTVYMQDADAAYISLNGANPNDKASIATVCGILQKFAAKGVRETVAKVPDDQFFHGMSIEFSQGDGTALYADAGSKLVYGAAGGKDSLVLHDSAAFKDFLALKVLPFIDISPNPVAIGQKVRLKGKNGDTAAAGDLIVYWTSLKAKTTNVNVAIFKGKLVFGAYDAVFSMPAYGTSADGTKVKLEPGKGYFTVKAESGSRPIEVELLPSNS
ncbi:copper amine oxidase N-terminal domain-containing protein [Paenibacillus sp. RUD330]|uniref:copper amine oxidase N-terminal domain-containing protein n=1 Tax=Paenibacillus sp. RUD330 TaxID=2023772 RepID=UPI0012FD9637|nr:copper amine oxidase N-terminal domain-containing protein [Paenibacillus sp. RUD330]ASS65210.2 copper amine oxidase N-terminal domain-containing protein [Paenibacillus sp. RUD330]